MVYEEMIFGFTVGVISIIVLIVSWKIYENYRKRLEKPYVVVFNLGSKNPLVPLGYFERFRNITIPVENGRSKDFWAIETNVFMIIPAYGSKEDMYIESDLMPKIKILMCEIIGTGRDGESAQRDWASIAFPQEMYDLPPVLEEVPNSYVFVKPLFRRGWAKEFLKEGIGQIKAVFSEMNRMTSVYERQLETLHSNYGDLIMSRIDSANQIVLSLWYHVLKTWDVISDYKVLPIAVMCRLLHIPMDKLNYTGLMEAVQHGNVRDVGAEVIGSFRDALQTLNEQFGMVPISAPLAQALFNRVSDMQERLAETTQQNRALQAQQLNNLIRQVSQSQATSPSPPLLQAPTQNGSRPVMKMYEEEEEVG